MSYGIIPRGKGFWVVRFLPDGTYETVERYATKVEAQQAIKALQNRHAAAARGTAKLKAR